MAKTAKKKASAKAEKVNKVEVDEVEVGSETEAAPADDGSQITIADLQAIAQVIDMAVRRGAFGASEVGDVSTIYNKLTGFLQVVAEQQRAAEAAQAGQ